MQRENRRKVQSLHYQAEECLWRQRYRRRHKNSGVVVDQMVQNGNDSRRNTQRFPQLNPAQVHDAFSYYYDNMDEVERDLAENEGETDLKLMAK